MSDLAISEVKTYLLELQNQICAFLEQDESQSGFQEKLPSQVSCTSQETTRSTFVEDAWSHAGGGGGLTRVLADSNVIEKAGVNFSHVYGKSLPTAATAKRPEFANKAFQALGVSVVVHPRNPYVPTCHFNVRFVVVSSHDTASHWWFGGGFDLTPYYGFIEDCQHWHQTALKACEPFGADVYPRFKKWCDEYFYLKHRKEPRGIGGLFFDDLNEWGFDKCFAFMRSVGEHFIKAYQPILSRRKHLAYGEKERHFQCLRRGRYVEFNLLYDRGTLFGIQSEGRTESILMSLPPVVNWKYNWQPVVNSEEERLFKEFLIPRDWI